ncbi:hypothetical protein [Streptomyces sp. NPDC014676]
MANTHDGLAQIAGMSGVPRSTVYGHPDKIKTVPRRPKKTTAAKP